MAQIKKLSLMLALAATSMFAATGCMTEVEDPTEEDAAELAELDEASDELSSDWWGGPPVGLVGGYGKGGLIGGYGKGFIGGYGKGGFVGHPGIGFGKFGHPGIGLGKFGHPGIGLGRFGKFGHGRIGYGQVGLGGWW